jgi:hypothetical protein
MQHTSQNEKDENEELTTEDQGRTGKADQGICEACEEGGLKVSSWKHFDAWQEYVDGTINENVLAAKAQTELTEFAKSFGKYLVIEKEDPSPSEDAEKKERVKRANKIYRTLCEATGLTFCFFNSFAVWSDYVQGKMGEKDFLEKAKMEVEKMVSESNLGRG